MGVIQRAFTAFSSHARKKRAHLFLEKMPLDARTTILDLGSEKGHAINRLLADTPIRAGNIFIADISASNVAQGKALFGYNPIILSENAQLPFPDGHFGVVFCSSVIEHVTVPKADVWSIESSRDFRKQAKVSQSRFATEIRRVAKSYFVQTPYRHFPIESHTWLPCVNWLPRSWLLKLLRITNRYWVKRTQPDFYLLNRREFCQLFPDAEIYVERFLGFPKSLIAIRTNVSDPPNQAHP